MPASIDPVTNMFGTGSSLIGRILISFGAGWLGNLISRLASAFEYWSDFVHIDELFLSFFENFGAIEVLNLVLWPLVLLYYLLEIPLYGLIAAPLLIFLLYRILKGDDPIMFWAISIVAILAPGLVLINPSIPAFVILGLFSVGIGAGLWYALNLDFPHSADWVREKTGMG